jgi:hypothetical protein
MEPMMAAQKQQMQAQFEAQRAARIEELQDREKRAQTDKEKADIQAEIKAIQAEPVPKLPDISKLSKDPNFQVYSLADALTGLISNVLLLIAGIGLVSLKDWGRVLGIWVLLIKIVLLVAMSIAFIVLIVPILAQVFGDFFEEMAKAGPQQRGAKPPVQEIAAIYGTMLTVMAAGIMIIGVIIWAIMLFFVSRPGVKAACATPPPMLDN